MVWRDAACRVVLVEEPGFAGWCRVIWNQHVKEFSDLDAGQRAGLMEVVAQTEQALRDVLAPVKMNLAALGTQAPHLHWHVVPRFENDATFPAPPWAAKKAEWATPPVPQELADSVRQRLQHLLGESL